LSSALKGRRTAKRPADNLTVKKEMLEKRKSLVGGTTRRNGDRKKRKLDSAVVRSARMDTEYATGHKKKRAGEDSEWKRQFPNGLTEINGKQRGGRDKKNRSQVVCRETYMS